VETRTHRTTIQFSWRGRLRHAWARLRYRLRYGKAALQQRDRIEHELLIAMDREFVHGAPTGWTEEWPPRGKGLS
jgi:hypothetical protein